jgi:hypothetical protein
MSIRIPRPIACAFATRSWRRALVIPLAAIVVAFPAAGYAQINAQPLTPQAIALTAQDLGPEWTMTSQQSDEIDGTTMYRVVYSSPSGRAVRIQTAVTTSVDLAEGVISYLRYQLEQEGMTISSVQDNGFGDGRAFKAEASDGQRTMVSYLFRVRNLTAFVDYVGGANAPDVQTQAVAVARKQEAKLFAVFAPPPASTPVPTRTTLAVTTAEPTEA